MQIISLNSSSGLAMALGDYAPILKLIGFFAVAALVAGFLAALDTASKHDQPTVVMKTTEWWLLLLVNALIAAILAYGAFKMSRLDLSFFGLITIIFGYPVLLHSKIFSYPGDSAGETKPIGLEYFLQTAETMLQKGIDSSVRDRRAQLQIKWEEIDINKLGQFAKVWFNNNSPGLSSEEINKRTQWIDKTLADVKANPKQIDGSRVSIFNAIDTTGKQRGICWVIDKCNNNK